MDKICQYNISLDELSDVRREYHFVADSDFYSHFDNTGIRGGRVDVLVTAFRRAEDFVFEFHLTGFVRLQCDRCLDEYDQPIDYSDSITACLSDVTDFDTDSDYVELSREATSIDVARFIYEFSVFAMPFSHFHPNNADGTSGCNKKMLDILNNHQPHQQSDPRWKKLEEIKNKNVLN